MERFGWASEERKPKDSFVGFRGSEKGELRFGWLPKIEGTKIRRFLGIFFSFATMYARKTESFMLHNSQMLRVGRVDVLELFHTSRIELFRLPYPGSIGLGLYFFSLDIVRRLLTFVLFKM
ncbi:hypothetical protein RIR_jg30682.t1 [Rhizophagus irregularis DAOM 181602=DAOM 197198]|nr:hypothetical protein RIR_jg30682.t1 [Rhizophagus irregularis DAOM 181602=DAOM 197198]